MKTETETSLTQTWLCAYQAILEMVDNLKSAYETGENDGIEKAQYAIQEDPLSIEVRSGWYSPGEKPDAPEEFCILLSTGGPASRIIGTLSEHGEPETARLEVQDWGTPWGSQWGTAEVQAALCDGAAEVTEVLLSYAREFYFGE